MSYQGTYASAQDILTIIQMFRPDFTLSNIKTGLIMLCETKVDSIIEDFGYETPAEDIRGMLKYAVICMYLEYSSRAGEIQNKHGEIKSRQIGQAKTEYDAMSPMFFFANGEARKFYGLIGHETWRMEAFHMIRAYTRAKYRRAHNSVTPTISLSTDETLRGYGWDQENWKTSEGQEYKSWWL